MRESRTSSSSTRLYLRVCVRFMCVDRVEKCEEVCWWLKLSRFSFMRAWKSLSFNDIFLRIVEFNLRNFTGILILFYFVFFLIYFLSSTTKIDRNWNKETLLKLIFSWRRVFLGRLVFFLIRKISHTAYQFALFFLISFHNSLIISSHSAFHFVFLFFVCVFCVHVKFMGGQKEEARTREMSTQKIDAFNRNVYQQLMIHSVKSQV